MKFTSKILTLGACAFAVLSLTSFSPANSNSTSFASSDANTTQTQLPIDNITNWSGVNSKLKYKPKKSERIQNIFTTGDNSNETRFRITSIEPRLSREVVEADLDQIISGQEDQVVSRKIVNVCYELYEQSQITEATNCNKCNRQAENDIFDETQDCVEIQSDALLSNNLKEFKAGLEEALGAVEEAGFDKYASAKEKALAKLEKERTCDYEKLKDVKSCAKRNLRKLSKDSDEYKEMKELLTKTEEKIEKTEVTENWLDHREDVKDWVVSQIQVLNDQAVQLYKTGTPYGIQLANQRIAQIQNLVNRYTAELNVTKPYKSSELIDYASKDDIRSLTDDIKVAAEDTLKMSLKTQYALQLDFTELDKVFAPTDMLEGNVLNYESRFLRDITTQPGVDVFNNSAFSINGLSSVSNQQLCYDSYQPTSPQPCRPASNFVPSQQRLSVSGAVPNTLRIPGSTQNLTNYSRLSPRG